MNRIKTTWYKWTNWGVQKSEMPQPLHYIIASNGQIGVSACYLDKQLDFSFLNANHCYLDKQLISSRNFHENIFMPCEAF